MEEAELVTLAQSGDLNSFNQLVLTYQEIAFNVAYRILTDDAAADDATQNAFLQAYRKLDSYRGGSFRAWLLRIVTNSCYDELRRRKRRPTTPLEPLDDTGEEEIEVAPVDGRRRAKPGRSGREIRVEPGGGALPAGPAG